MLFAALGALCACSLQSFDYLSQGATDAGADGTIDGTSDSDSGASDDGSTPRDAAGDARDAGPRDAAPDGPINYIVNNNFDNGLIGWTVSPESVAQKGYVYAQPPASGGVTPQGQANRLGTWTNVEPFSVDLSQTPTGLPAGSYTFAGWFNRGTNKQAYIYAKDCWGPDAGVDGGQVKVDIPMPPTTTTWVEVKIPGIAISGGTCQVGFFVDANTLDWLNADGFSLMLDTASPRDASAD